MSGEEKLKNKLPEILNIDLNYYLFLFEVSNNFWVQEESVSIKKDRDCFGADEFGDWE